MRLPVDLPVQQHVRVESLRRMSVEKKAVRKKKRRKREREREREKWRKESTNKSSSETMLLKVANCPALLLPATAGWTREKGGGSERLFSIRRS